LKIGVGIPFVDVSNVLNEEKKNQVLALGQLGWCLRQIEKATGVSRETAGGYLKAAGIGLRPPGAWGKKAPPKTGQWGDHRPTGGKAGQWRGGDHRPRDSGRV
jgi:hypothetical protein